MVWKAIRARAAGLVALGYGVGFALGFMGGSALRLELYLWQMAIGAGIIAAGLFLFHLLVGSLRATVAGVEDSAESWIEFQDWTARAHEQQLESEGEIEVGFESAEWEPGRD